MGEKEIQQYLERIEKDIDEHNTKGNMLRDRFNQVNNHIIRNIREIKEDAQKSKGICMPLTEYWSNKKDERRRKERLSAISQDPAYNLLHEKLNLFGYITSSDISPDYLLSEREYIRTRFDQELKVNNKSFHGEGYQALRELQRRIENRTLKEKEYLQILNGTHPWLKPLLRLEEEIRLKKIPKKKASSLREWLKLFPYFFKKES